MTDPTDSKETVTSAKRKLSASATHGTSESQIKRSKSASEAVDGSAAEEVAVPAATEPKLKGFVDDDDEDRKPSSDVQAKTVETFYLWDEALSFLLALGEDAEAALRLKSAVLEAWLPIKDDKEKHEYPDVDGITQWFVYVEEGSPETEAGKRLLEMYDAESKDNWWWELDLQREKPEEGVAALQLKLKRVAPWRGVDERDGVWWVTEQRVAEDSEDGVQAMNVFVNYLAGALN